jgi:hypothetical protein
VVAAVRYFATLDDQADLLDYLGEPNSVSLHPWPVVRAPLDVLTRRDAVAAAQVMVIQSDLGPPAAIRPADRAMAEASKAGIFNRINWNRVRRGPRDGLVDSNASPVLFWRPGEVTGSVIRVSDIGSQADAIAAVSDDYERWVNRVIGWVRRNGTKVWGIERDAVRPDLNIDLNFVNNVYALPSALRALEGGAAGRR